MTRRTSTILLAVTALLVLLLASSPGLAEVPDCTPAQTKTVTAYSADGVTIQVTSPDTFRSCPTEGCCDTITITGVPTGWRIAGNLISSFVFTTMCADGQGAFPPAGRQELDTIPFDSPGGAALSFKVCYPRVHEWPSFETHVDLQGLIFNAAGVQVGVLGPGSDWDTFCNTVGCTPGKWKNWTGLGKGNQSNLWPLPYLPGSSTFSFAFGRSYSGNAGLKMLQALNLGGSGENGMARHCTAALLNAKWTEGQPWIAAPGKRNDCQDFANGTPDVADIVALVQSAYDHTGETFASAMAKCAAMNESLCPMDGVWMKTDNGNSECDASSPGTPCNPF